MSWTNIIHDLLSYDASSPMLFNSGQFLFFFILFLIAYSFLYNNKLSRTLFVLGFSFFFYYKASGWYLIVLLITLAVDYLLAHAIYKAKQQKYRTLWLIFSLCTSLGLLAYFKYTNFFLENWALLSGNDFEPLDIFLPIGISFYTFQTLSYIIDVYKRELTPTNNFWIMLFICAFSLIWLQSDCKSQVFSAAAKKQNNNEPRKIKRIFSHHARIIQKSCFSRLYIAI